MLGHDAISEAAISGSALAASASGSLMARRAAAITAPPDEALRGCAKRSALLLAPPIEAPLFVGPRRRSRQQYRRTIHSATPFEVIPVPMADRASRCARGDTLSLHPDLLSGRTVRRVSLETSLITPVHAHRRFARGDVVVQGSNLPVGAVVRGRAPSGDEPNFGPFTGPRRKSRKQFRRTLPSNGANNSLITVVHAHRRFARGDTLSQLANLPTGLWKRSWNPGDQVVNSGQFVGPRRKSRQQYRRTLPIDVQGAVLADFVTFQRRYARSHIRDLAFYFKGHVFRGLFRPDYLDGKRKHRDVRPQQFPVPEGRVTRSLPVAADAAQDPVQRRRVTRGDNSPAFFPVQVTRRPSPLEESGAVGADKPVRMKAILRTPGSEMLGIAPFRRRHVIQPPEDPVFMRRRPRFFEWISPTVYDVYKSGRTIQFATGESEPPGPCPERPVFTDPNECPARIYTETEDAPAALVEESNQLPLVVSDSETLPGRIDEEDSRPPYMNECR